MQVAIVGPGGRYKRRKLIDEKQVMKAFVKLGKCVTGGEALKVMMNPYMDLRPDIIIPVYGHYRHQTTPFEWFFSRNDQVAAGGLVGFQCVANSLNVDLWRGGGATENALCINGTGASVTAKPAGFNEDLDTAVSTPVAGMVRKGYASYRVIRNKITIVVENAEAFDVFIGARVEAMNVETGGTALSIPEVFPMLGTIDMDADRTIEDLDDILPGFTLTKVHGTSASATVPESLRIKSLTIDVPIAKLQNKMAKEAGMRVDERDSLAVLDANGTPNSPSAVVVVQFICIPVSSQSTLATEDETGHFRTTLVAVKEAFTEMQVLFADPIKLAPTDVLVA